MGKDDGTSASMSGIAEGLLFDEQLMRRASEDVARRIGEIFHRCPDALLSKILNQTSGPGREALRDLDPVAESHARLGATRPSDLARVRAAVAHTIRNEPPSPPVRMLLYWIGRRLAELPTPLMHELKSMRIERRLAYLVSDQKRMQAILEWFSEWTGDPAEGALHEGVLQIFSGGLDDESWGTLLDRVGSPAVPVAAARSPVEPIGSTPAAPLQGEPIHRNNTGESILTSPPDEPTSVPTAWMSPDGSKLDEDLSRLQDSLGELCSTASTIRQAAEEMRYSDVSALSATAQRQKEALERDLDAWCQANGVDRTELPASVVQATRTPEDVRSFLSWITGRREVLRAHRAKKRAERNEEIASLFAAVGLAVPKEVSSAATIEDLEHAFASMRPTLHLAAVRLACINNDPSVTSRVAELDVTARLTLHEDLATLATGGWIGQAAALVADQPLFHHDPRAAGEIAIMLATRDLDAERSLPSGFWALVHEIDPESFSSRLGQLSDLLDAMERRSPSTWSAPELVRLLRSDPPGLPRVLRGVLRDIRMASVPLVDRPRLLAGMLLDEEHPVEHRVLIDALHSSGRDVDALALAAAHVVASVAPALSTWVESEVLSRLLDEAQSSAECAWLQEATRDLDPWAASSDGLSVLLFLVDRLHHVDLGHRLKHGYDYALRRMEEERPELGGLWLVPRLKGQPTGVDYASDWRKARRAWDDWNAQLALKTLHQGFMPHSAHYQTFVNKELLQWLAAGERGEPLPGFDADDLLDRIERSERFPPVRSHARDHLIEYIHRQRERLDLVCNLRRSPLAREHSSAPELFREAPRPLRDGLLAEAAAIVSRSAALERVYTQVIEEVAT